MKEFSEARRRADLLQSLHKPYRQHGLQVEQALSDSRDQQASPRSEQYNSCRASVPADVYVCRINRTYTVLRATRSHSCLAVPSENAIPPSGILCRPNGRRCWPLGAQLPINLKARPHPRFGAMLQPLWEGSAPIWH